MIFPSAITTRRPVLCSEEIRGIHSMPGIAAVTPATVSNITNIPTVKIDKGVRNKKPFANRILAGGIILAITSIVSILSFMDIVKFAPPILEGFFIMTVVFATALASRFTQIHSELETAHENLKTLDKLKDDFLANTSHELRTPLFGITGIAESLINGATGQLPEDTVRNLSLIISSGNRLADLVNDILDLSRIKNNDIRLDMNSVDIRQITKIVIIFTKPLLKGKNIEIINRIPEDCSIVYGDENRLQQIMYNIIGNAVKFTEKGEIIISSKTKDDLLEITIQDTGIGISADKLDTVFNAFEKIDEVSTGAGLGLSITKYLVELHKGTISVESKPGQGAMFTFTIPLYYNQGKDENSHKDQKNPLFIETRNNRTYPNNHDIIPIISDDDKSVSPSASGQNGSILIVDDEAVNLHVMRNQLGLAGYKVTTAENGNTALEILEKRLFDAVLLDVMMPKISGLEVCRKIRDKQTPYDLPVLMITALNRSEDIVAGLEAGANDYLSKPVNSDVMLARVRTMISLKHAVKNFEEAKFKNLQKRMNPHFLFNAINTIRSLIHSDPDTADDATLMLAEIYRFIMDTSFDPIIPFEEEWLFIKEYMNFEKLRFPDTLSFEADKKGDFSDVYIPPLILQPIVSNSIKHGLRNKTGQGCVKLFAKKEGDEIKIVVIDDGVGLDSADPFTRSLGNIRDRLQHQFNDSELTIRNRKTGGVEVNIFFKLKKSAA